MAQDDAQGVWLPLAEAAERSGRHKEALRARAKRGGFPIRRNNLGHMLVLMPPELLNGAQVSNGHDAQAAQVSNAQPAQANRELVDELRDRISGLEDLLEAERTELKAERRAHLEARDRAAHAEGEVLPLREALADLSARLDRAEALLALPWWRRLFG